jgi:acyl-CoA synthetase (AMP-forming)/AMP-acid ligase II
MRLHSNTVVAVLERTARHLPSRGVTMLDRRGQNADFRSYADIVARAHVAARRLAAAGLDPGDRILICLNTSWDLIDAFLGCILRGTLPTLVAPAGTLGGAPAHARKLAALVELMGSKRLLCDDSGLKELQEFGADEAARMALTVGALQALTPVSGGPPRDIAPDDLAFMQLTSGSTGQQRAVMIRHSNVVSNTLAIARTLGLSFGDESSDGVSWLPLNHDMGLVGCFFVSLSVGLNLTLLRPDTFLARPRLWLERIGKSRRVCTAAPNFAYQLCVERADPAELVGCDLSQWHSAMTGAEMIRPETCAAFAEKFAPLGFRPNQFQPCYGMAEATLEVTCDMRNQGVRIARDPNDLTGREVVCCGAPILDTVVRIAPPGSLDALAEGRVGEVLAKGPGIFAGYYNDSAATQATLQDGWLRTGDLGFLKGGELYLTGRIKDLLIINGHNWMPHEIEWLAESAAGGGGAERCGAFSIEKPGEGEHAVVVVELGDATPEALHTLPHDIRSRIGRELGLPLADVVLVKRGQIPKTTSGKVQRKELRQRYLNGTLERLA